MATGHFQTSHQAASPSVEKKINSARPTRFSAGTKPTPLPATRLSDEVATEFVKWSVKPTGRGTLMWKIDPAVRECLQQTARTHGVDVLPSDDDPIDTAAHRADRIKSAIAKLTS